MDFIGQQKIVSFFDNAILAGNLAHAYCFSGSDNIGKRTLAQIIAGKLLNVVPGKLSSHPDYYFVKREEDQKTGKLKKDISIAQTRALIGRLQSKSWIGGYRVAIIDEAEKLNQESSNALLKLLEEPGEKTILFLLTDNDGLLLPTIRSRCQIFYFLPVSGEEIQNSLKEFDREDAAMSAKISWGRPGRAINYLQNEEIRDSYHAEVERFQKMRGKAFHEKLKLSDDLFGDKTDHIRARDRLDEVIDLWLMEWREALRQNCNNLQVCEIMDDLQEAKKYLNQNIHPRLLLERIFLKY